jgi:hypothetical protein
MRAEQITEPVAYHAEAGDVVGPLARVSQAGYRTMQNQG